MADEQKLKSLIAFIAADRPRVGKVKLFKLMYLIDFTAHAELGHSITGETYESFPMGPVPTTVWHHFAAITRDCVRIESVNMVDGMLPEQQMTARADFTQTLDDAEIAIAKRILVRYGSWSGNSLKELTHKQLPYLATAPGAMIPYGLAGYLDYKKPSEADAAKLRADDGLMASLREAVMRKKLRAA